MARRTTLNPDGIAAMLHDPDLVEVLDRIVSTIANEAERNLKQLPGYDESSPARYRPHFAVDGESTARASNRNRGRYRASVRTHSNAAVRASFHHQVLERAVESVKGRIA